jgi:hypothetical protein
MVTLSTPRQCLVRAEACERCAAAATNVDVRKIMLSLAQHWRALAAEGAVESTSDGATTRPVLPSCLEVP